MKRKKCMGIILVFSLIAFMGCNRSNNEPANVPQDEPTQETNQLVLKSYKVPPGFSGHLGVIKEILGGHGRATVAPDGQILVAAPQSFHDGIKDFIEQLEKNFPTPSSSVEVNYWIVAGRNAKTPAKLDEFHRIKPALETIQINQGNMEFKLLDHLAVTSSSQGTPTTIWGALGRIEQEVSAFSDGTLVINPAFIFQEMLPPNNNWKDRIVINTQIEMKSGELVVLGQSSREFVGRPIFEPEKEGEKHIEIVNVYYIISADVKK